MVFIKLCFLGSGVRAALCDTAKLGSKHERCPAFVRARVDHRAAREKVRERAWRAAAVPRSDVQVRPATPLLLAVPGGAMGGDSSQQALGEVVCGRDKALGHARLWDSTARPFSAHLRTHATMEHNQTQRLCRPLQEHV